MNYCWTLTGHRKRVHYENPERRRVNVLAAMTYAPSPSLSWISLPRTLKADDLIAFLSSLRLADSLTVVVVDNASMHRSKLVKAARLELVKHGVVLYFLPPYSPELNLIEPVFGVIKHYDMPERSYSSVDDLSLAVDDAFRRANQRISIKTQQHLRPAA